MNYVIRQCTICYEAWPIKTGSKKPSGCLVCPRCKLDKKNPKKFSNQNNMVPSAVPNELKYLTQFEEMLVSRAFVVMQVYVKPGLGYFGYKGHTITLPHNVQKVANVLPNIPTGLPVISFSVKGKMDNTFEFKVRRAVVLKALQWLISNNPLYKHVTLDMGRINSLPEDGYIIVDTIELTENKLLAADEGPSDEDPSDEDKRDIQCTSFLPSVPSQTQEIHKVKSSINGLSETNQLEISSQGLNELSTSCVATMAFPCLFPDGKGDPTNLLLVRDISNNETEAFSLKLKLLMKFVELIDGKWHYRFASHPRFGYWAYNMLFRKRLLGQGNFYIKQTRRNTHPDLDELREMARNRDGHRLMSILMHYAKNVTGTNAYWNQQKNNLKAIISQKGAPTIFWTLSCAEFHWPEFHALFDQNNTQCNSAITNVIKNPHILDWFFTERVESFLKHWLYNIMGASWHWFRYEFTVLRGAIHVHGLAKLESDPDLNSLAEIATNGHLATKKLESECNLLEQEIIGLQNEVTDGLEAEHKICKYHDLIYTTMNPEAYDEYVRPKVHPCQREFSDIVGNLSTDYIQLVNTVQRHTKCNSGYCLRQDKDGKQYCRFRYPFQLVEQTYLEYEPHTLANNDIVYRPKVVSQRNDPRVNRHQQNQLQGWRANCDIQLVIDHHACIEYLAKYASKAEKMSSIVNETFKSVVSKADYNSDPKSVIRKLMIQGVGERDMSIQEVMHSILGLKLVSSTFLLFMYR